VTGQLQALVIDLSINKAMTDSKRGKRGAAHTSAEERLRAAKASELCAEMASKLALRVGSAVGEGALRELPDALVGIELRGVARKAVEVQTGIAVLQRSNGFAAVDRAVVPHHDHSTSQVAEQASQEGADLGVSDVVRREREVEAVAPAARAHREAGDDGDPVVSLAMPKQRRLAARRPGAPHARDQEEARLVDEDEVGAQPRGFFLMCGQVLRFQRSIRASSRSSARRSGFCTLQPRSRKSLPT